MDVKSNVLPKSVQRTAPAPIARPDEKELSTDVPTPPTPPPSLRDTLIQELLGSEEESNRFYEGTSTTSGISYTPADVTTSGGGAIALNSLVQGTGWSQRLGDSVRNRRLRFRIHVRCAINPTQVSNSGVPGTDLYSNAFRLVIFIDKMPPIGTPVFQDAGSWGLGATPPTSPNAVFTSPRAPYVSATTPYPGAVLVAVRNPQTLSRYHVLYDRIHNPSSRYESALQVAATTSWALAQASEYIDLEFDLHGLVTQWYDQANSQAWFKNCIRFLLVADAPDTTPVNYKFMSELEFENVA